MINFGPRDMEDVHAPHNDVMVIHAKVANYEVKRMFVDSRSLLNVIFQEAFDQMDLQVINRSQSR